MAKKYQAIFIINLLFLILIGNAVAFTDSVVKIFTTSNRIDYYHPWQTQGSDLSVGSGTIIANNLILTNAHVVSDQTFIQVKKNSDSKAYKAQVVAIGHDCDLALLTVSDPEFFKGTTPLELGGLPRLRDKVTVAGYPTGGGEISITEGVVSRIEVTPYSESSRALLTVQIDAAINPGNSGGPVLQDGKIIGVVMQALQSGQNIGYVIPVPIISHFSKDLEDSKYDGFPLLGIDFTTMDNPALRKFYRLDKYQGGILIENILPFSSAEKTLKQGDVILKIDDTPIGEDGTFLFRDNERLAMGHLISNKQMGDNLKLEIIRDGKLQDFTVPLKDYSPLIAYPNSLTRPPYYIFGGIVFTVLSSDLMQSWGERWWETVPIDFGYYLFGTGRLNIHEQKDIVVLLNVLSDEINTGYHTSKNMVIETVNGKKFKSFKEFVLLLDKIKKKEEYTIFETEENSHIILNNSHVDDINKEILKRNEIPYPFSRDVAQWLGANDMLY